MKILKYKLMTEVNIGTEEEPNIVEDFYPKEVECPDEAFDTMYAAAKAEAYKGEVTVVNGPPDPEPTPAEDDSVWDELDAAYQEGVNSAYDK